MAHDFFQSVKKIVTEIKTKSSEMLECNSNLTRELNDLVISCGGMSVKANTPISPRTSVLLPLIERFKTMVNEKGEKTKLTPKVLMDMVCCLLHNSSGQIQEGEENRTHTPCKIESSTTPTPQDDEEQEEEEEKDDVEEAEEKDEVTNAMVCFRPKMMELIRQSSSSNTTSTTNKKARRDSDTEQLKIVWEQLCRADSLLQQFSSFWLNMEVMVDLLMKKNEYIDNFVKYTKNERIQRRFFEHLDMYTRWWMSIQNVCKEYFVATQKLLGGDDPSKSVYSFLEKRAGKDDSATTNGGDVREGFRVLSID